jgi:hypothetical protein
MQIAKARNSKIFYLFGHVFNVSKIRIIFEMSISHVPEILNFTGRLIIRTQNKLVQK